MATAVGLFNSNASEEFFLSSTNVTHMDISTIADMDISTVTDNYDYSVDPENFQPHEYEKDFQQQFLPLFYSIFFLFGLLGNCLVIWVILCGARLRSMTDVCLLNLAIADLLLVCSLPFLAHQSRDQWKFGDPMCKIVLGVYQIVLYCGIFFICLMSVDRYLAVVHAVYALRVRSLLFGRIAAVVTWMAGFLASFPDLIFIKQQKAPDMSQYCAPAFHEYGDLHFWTIFSLFKMNLLGLILPFSLLCFCYSQIIWKLLHSHSSKKQAIRLVFMVVTVFCFCWVPYNVASFFRALELLQVYRDSESSNAIRLALQITEVLAYAHSCLNPTLYVFAGEKFRRQLLRLISKTPCTLCQMIKVYMPQDRLFGSVYSQNTSLDERSTGV